MSAIDEQRFTALGREWVCRFDFNAICAIEERTGEPFMAIAAPFLGALQLQDSGDAGTLVAVAAKLRMSDVRMVMHQALLSAQPSATEELAGEIIGEAGLDTAFGIVGWAISKAMPVSKGGGAAGEGNPPKPRPRRKAGKAG